MRNPDTQPRIIVEPDANTDPLLTTVQAALTEQPGIYLAALRTIAPELPQTLTAAPNVTPGEASAKQALNQATQHLHALFAHRLDRHIYFDPPTEDAIMQDPLVQSHLATTRSRKTYTTTKGGRQIHKPNPEADTARDTIRHFRIAAFCSRALAYADENANATH